ncbi:MAG: hypothetical protein L0I62_04015 [Gammaproteobacteria bacterium]|nr:hypothetical protein [Gammaproteobacteria bacterium]
MPEHGSGQNDTLRRRLAAAAVLLPAVILWALLAPLTVFAAAGAVLILLCAWEWASLSGISGVYARCAILAISLLCMAFGWWIILHWPTATTALLVAFSLLWVLVALDLRRRKIHAPRALYLLQGALVLLPTWFAFVALRHAPDGPELVLALLAWIFRSRKVHLVGAARR